MTRILVALVVIVILTSASMAVADVPTAISYQGKLTSAEGKPVPDDSYPVTFRLYREEVDGKPVWTSAPLYVYTFRGVFNTLIGGIPDEVFDLEQLFLETSIKDEPMRPRQRIVSVGYSFRAQKAYDISDLAVSESKIAAGAVTSAKIAPGAVSGDKVADAAVTSLKIADGAVTSPKIANGAVSSTKLNLPLIVSSTQTALPVIRGNNTSTLKGIGVQGSTSADGSDLLAVGIGGNHGISLRSPQDWNLNYKRAGVYGYASSSGTTPASSGHGVMGWSEHGYGGLFHSTFSDALAVDGRSVFSGDLEISGARTVSAPSGVTIQGPGDLRVVVGTGDITIRGDAAGTYIRILANGTIELKSAGNMNLTAGGQLNLAGTYVNIDSNVSTDINSGGQTNLHTAGSLDLQGSVINLN